MRSQEQSIDVDVLAICGHKKSIDVSVTFTTHKEERKYCRVGNVRWCDGEGLESGEKEGGGWWCIVLIYLRPNLLNTETLVSFFIKLLLLLLSRRSDGSARAHAAIDVLLFLLSRFQNLVTWN
jgi:hypothetical protein